MYIDLKKRVLVQASDEPNPETGELDWVDEDPSTGADGEDGEGGPTEEKIYIGKVRGCLSGEMS